MHIKKGGRKMLGFGKKTDKEIKQLLEEEQKELETQEKSEEKSEEENEKA